LKETFHGQIIQESVSFHYEIGAEQEHVVPPCNKLNGIYSCGMMI